MTVKKHGARPPRFEHARIGLVAIAALLMLTVAHVGRAGASTDEGIPMASWSVTPLASAGFLEPDDGRGMVEQVRLDVSCGGTEVDDGSVVSSGEVTVGCRLRLGEGADVSDVSDIRVLDGDAELARLDVRDLVADGSWWRLDEQVVLGDGAHRLVVEVVDERGVCTRGEGDVFVCDLEPPELEVSQSTECTSDAVEVRASVLDSSSVDLEMRATCSHAGTTTEQTRQLSVQSGQQSCFLLDQPGCWDVSLCATDQAGRKTERHLSCVIDREPPHIESAVLSPAAANVVRRGDGSVEWHLSQEARLALAVADGGDETDACELRLVDDGRERGLHAQWETERANGTLTLLLEPGDVLQGDVCTVSDRAGNELRVPLGACVLSGDGLPAQQRADVLVVDGTPPVLALEAPEEGSCLPTPARVVLQVADDAFRSICDGTLVWGDSAACDLELSVDGAFCRQLSRTEFSCTEERLGEVSCVCAEDGVYSLVASCTDWAGNAADPLRRTFIVDTTPPVLSVEFHDDDAANGRYYRGPRTATVRVEDRNFDEAGTSLDTNGVVGPWRVEGDAHEADVSFDHDGTFHLSVRAADRAGHEAFWSCDDFVVDLTPPSISFSGVEDSHAYRGDVAPVVLVADDNADPEGEAVLLAGSRHEPMPLSRESHEGQASSYPCPGFSFEQVEDDVYTLTARAQDLAGNESTAELTFSVNRFGSTYRIAPESQVYLDGNEGSGQRCYADDVSIDEINVCDLVDQRVFVARDDVVTALPERDAIALGRPQLDASYAVSRADDGGAWRCYRYVIAQGTFAEEGVYRVMLDSTDAAGNVSSNTLARSDADVGLVIDRTPPSITVEGVRPNETYQASRLKVTIGATDDVELASLTVALDGAEVPVDESGQAVLFIDAGEGSHDLSIAARDRAGNVTTRTDLSGICVQAPESRWPVWWPCVPAGVVAVFVLAAILMRHRRAQGGNPPPP